MVVSLPSLASEKSTFVLSSLGSLGSRKRRPAKGQTQYTGSSEEMQPIHSLIREVRGRDRCLEDEGRET